VIENFEKEGIVFFGRHVYRGCVPGLKKQFLIRQKIKSFLRFSCSSQGFYNRVFIKTKKEKKLLFLIGSQKTKKTTKIFFPKDDQLN
jgi:hypothetical protein